MITTSYAIQVLSSVLISTSQMLCHSAIALKTTLYYVYNT